MTKRIQTLIAVLLITLGVFAGTAAATNGGNPNSPEYWESRTEHPSECYKHDADGGAHGGLSDGGKAVKLKTFQQSWPGDHWELLIVKGGSRDVGYGAGNAVYAHPSAGVNYYPPTNNGGQKPQVSHWIVCKGTTPTPTTTTVPPTTTTVPPTTTTEPPVTTTTLPPTTTTEPPAPTTTEPEVTTTLPPTTLPPETTQPPVTTQPPTTLPPTTVPPTTQAPTTTVVVTVPDTTVAPTTTVDVGQPPVPTTVPPQVGTVTALPSTGQDMTLPLILAALAVATGIALLLVRRPSAN